MAFTLNGIKKNFEGNPELSLLKYLRECEGITSQRRLFTAGSLRLLRGGTQPAGSALLRNSDEQSRRRGSGHHRGNG